jgi:hypothetical protein
LTLLTPLPVSPPLAALSALAPKQFEQQQRSLEQRLGFRSGSLPVGLGLPAKASFVFNWLIRFVSCLSI